jgi:hypothetical protein
MKRSTFVIRPYSPTIATHLRRWAECTCIGGGEATTLVGCRVRDTLSPAPYQCYLCVVSRRAQLAVVRLASAARRVRRMAMALAAAPASHGRLSPASRLSANRGELAGSSAGSQRVRRRTKAEDPDRSTGSKSSVLSNSPPCIPFAGRCVCARRACTGGEQSAAAVQAPWT